MRVFLSLAAFFWGGGGQGMSTQGTPQPLGVFCFILAKLVQANLPKAPFPQAFR